MTTQSIVQQSGANKSVIAFYDGVGAAECPLIMPLVTPEWSTADGVEEVELIESSVSGITTDVVDWSIDNEGSWTVSNILSRCAFLLNVKFNPYINLSSGTLTVGLRNQDVIKCSDIALSGTVTADFDNGSQQTSASLPFTVAGNLTFWQTKGFAVRYTIRYLLPNGMIFEKQIRWQIKSDLLPGNVVVTETADLRQLRQVIVRRTITHNVCGAIVKKWILVCSDTENMNTATLEPWLS